MRDATERPEVLEAEMVKLVGADVVKVVRKTSLLLEDDAVYQSSMSNASNPYGEGWSGRRLAAILSGYQPLPNEN